MTNVYIFTLELNQMNGPHDLSVLYKTPAPQPTHEDRLPGVGILILVKSNNDKS